MGIRGLARAVTATAVLAWLGTIGCTSGQGLARAPLAASVVQDSVLAITHATVIDPVLGAVEHHDMAIVIRRGRIVSVGPTAGVDIPPGAVVHDASGRFVIPGLWDAHDTSLRRVPTLFRSSSPTV